MRTRCAKGALTLLAIFTSAAAARGEGVRVHLRGAARIDAQGVRAEGSEMLLRGALTDDAGSPLAGGRLAIAIARGAAPARPLAGSEIGEPRGCGTGQALPVERDGTLRIATDDGGRFCARIPLGVDRYVVHVAYAGNPLVDGATIDAPVDLSRRACSLAFAPEPRVLSLDARATTIEASATLESDGTTVPGAGLPLTLSTERAPSSIASATTDAAGHARFVIEPSRLGPPGRGELRLAFAGNADTASGLRVASIERHAHVALDVPGAPDGILAPGSPEDGISLVVTARAAGGEVAAGSVEARVNDAVVGAGAVEAGSARLLVTFASPESSGPTAEVPLVLRYVPSGPWYEPGVESTWRLPLRGRSPWRQLPLVLAGLGVAAWFTMARAQRAQARAKTGAAKPRAVARGEAKVEVVKEARSASEGWRGRVTDADDATGVDAARVSIERPAFGRGHVLVTSLTDAEGRFELAPADARPGDELAIDAPLHVSLRRPLPRAGELDVQVVLRKRALLARLVTWARRRGRPFDARPEPTPAQVRHAAGGDFRVARWADAVERAAFGGEPVDARIEGEVDRLAPDPLAAPPSSPRDDALANPTKANR